MIFICSICHRYYCPDSCPNAKYIDILCPVCSAEYPDHFYIDGSGAIVGCDVCLRREEAERYFHETRNNVPLLWRRKGD
ncbi:MAG: hypothetical protein IJ391_02670 [Clostridia bacterium]|nr:hypothetical protein [Clostridia bacterium]